MTKESFIENILGSHEVQDALCINRSRLNALINSGKLKPIKEMKNENLFWKPDVIGLRNEMLKDPRTNLYKNEKGDAKKYA
jgi:hypothetical protein